MAGGSLYYSLYLCKFGIFSQYKQGEKEWDTMKKGNLKRTCGFKYLTTEIKIQINNGRVGKRSTSLGQGWDLGEETILKSHKGCGGSLQEVRHPGSRDPRTGGLGKQQEKMSL